ncbi:alpha/beta fold hydrolase [Streptomyces sp. NPDC005820]|uniref:alpha/beta hydrolase n=1 Tax=Streptomyces sp. NPDC005820 TaxID=3157069 RepID=UPI0033FE90B9
MTALTAARAVVADGVRRLVLDADGIPLSGLVCEPVGAPPRAVVVALHGGGMNAGYFHGQAHPDLSLAVLGARLGYTVLAIDRPGYGESAAVLPEGMSLRGQAAALHAALRDFTSRYDRGAGMFLLAHSYGGKLALTAAQDAGDTLLGLDISGCGHRYAVEPEELPNTRRHGRFSRNWGALRLYPPNTFGSSASLVAPVPAAEEREARSWPGIFPEVAARVRVPVRLTFAEYESWWHHDESAAADLTARFTAAPRVVLDRQPHAGHNISLGWAARSYHLRALAFLEECLSHTGRGR